MNSDPMTCMQNIHNITMLFLLISRYSCHVIVQGGMIYLCTTDTRFRKARAFAFLDEVYLAINSSLQDSTIHVHIYHSQCVVFTTSRY